MLPLLEDKVVLVSGGSQGLGAAVARPPRANGAEASSSPAAATTRREVRRRAGRAGRPPVYVQADVSDVAQAQAAVAETVVDEFGRVDCLVNCAGLTTRGTLLDTTPELFDEHIAVNLRGPFFLDAGRGRGHGRPRGAAASIVNIITMAAHGGQPYLAPYVAPSPGSSG